MLNINRINRVLAELDCEQMLITDPNAIFYLTGKWIFPGERFLGLLIRQGEEPVLYLNELFRFEENLGIQKIYIKDTDNIASLLAQKVNHHATVTYVAMDKHNNVAKASQQITSQASAKAEPTNEAPKITMSAAKATIGVYDDFSMLDYVASITDDTDDSTYLKAHLLVDGTPNENAAGTYQLSCYVYDSQGSKSNVEKFTLTRQ